MFERILVAHDGSPGGWKAFEMGVELALEAGGALHVACIAADKNLYAKQRDATRDTWAESDSHRGGLALDCRSRAAQKGLNIETTACPSHKVQVIIDLTHKQVFDLLLVGDTGHASIDESLWNVPLHKLRDQNE